MARNSGSTSSGSTGSRQRPSAVANGRRSAPRGEHHDRSLPRWPKIERAESLREAQEKDREPSELSAKAPAATINHRRQRGDRLRAPLLPVSDRRLPSRFLRAAPARLDGAEPRSSEPFRCVHVLGVSRRVHVPARRDRPDDIGNREDRGLARRSVERGDEPVVAVLLMRRNDIGLEPVEGRDRSAVDELIVDLESGRQTSTRSSRAARAAIRSP